jgi:methylated-DNA-[protein]-cysteine S-methyltransferase
MRRAPRGALVHDGCVGELRVARFESPVGPLTLVAGDGGLRALVFDGEERSGEARPGEHPVLAQAFRQLGEYFEGRRRMFELPLELAGTPFQEDAWRALASIPFGTTISYGEQARRLGRPAAARAVGAANACNPTSIVLPCHRVVGSDGALTGYGGGLDVKRALLEHETRVLAAGS